MRSLRVWATALSSLALSTSLAAAQATTTAGSVTVWLPYWNMPAALASTYAHAGQITTASPYWYAVAGASDVQLETGAGDPAVVSGLEARGVKLMPMVTENAYMPAFARILATPRLRRAMVATLVGIADHSGYAGLDLDFENLALDAHPNLALSEQVAATYPGFVSEVCDAVHAIGRRCDVTVMAQTGPAPTRWRTGIATWVYDYGALAKAADAVQIMAYDDHSAPGAVGPVAPIGWVRQVIAYAATQMPLTHAVLGLAAYGYDWSPGGGTSVTAAAALRLAQTVGAPVRWSAAQQEETFRYVRDGVPHTVWFENAKADRNRAELAQGEGLSGVAIWAIGDEDPGLWSLLPGHLSDRSAVPGQTYWPYVQGQRSD